jgi:transposase
VDTIAVTRRHDLSDAQWAALEPLLPEPARSGRPSLFSKRQLIDGGINRLKRNRGVATRFDKLAVRYEATLHIAAINEWL